MKITNFDLIQINNFFEQCGGKKLPQKINFAIMKNMAIIKPDVELYQQALQGLFKTYDEDIIKKEDGTPETDEQGIPKLKEEKQEEFNKELIDLLNMQIDINFYIVDDEIFNYDDGDKYDPLSAQEIFNLQRIICEEKEDIKNE